MVAQPARTPVAISVLVSGTAVAVETVDETTDTADKTAGSVDRTTGDRWLRFGLWILLFGSAAGLMRLIFLFLNESQKHFVPVFERLANADKHPQVLAVSPLIEPAEFSATSLQQNRPAATTTSKITGPAKIEVGEHALYEAIDTTTNNRTSLKVQWNGARDQTVTPPDMLAPEESDHAYLTATQRGTIKLTVKVT